MVSWLKRLVAPVAAVAILGLASTAALADSVVSYTTSLTFTSSGTNVLDTGDYSLTFNSAVVANLSLTRNGVVPLGTAVAANFGTFSTNADSFEAFNGQEFSFSVLQTDPATTDNNPFGLQGTVTGFVAFDELAQVTVLHFNSTPSFVIGDGLGFPPSVHYTINQDQTIDNQTPGFTNIRGTVAAVPLPGVALAGMALFGCVGGLRKNRSAALAS
jgi:hypothetical protein